ncbi:hypothetical protein CDD81_1963 [Ophiocordyceps australis]|uniref:Glycosyl transferase CAP10 domain-containing protein n=1 Tax=Ophiocordyceps australis TaxID=1399860 RepID=A0A2C5XXR1_9HYPO|nr:hypothetical protein CDD81_1963 [Ophiocordyceps australis]
MARYVVVQLLGLSCVVSFLFLSHSLGRLSLTESPQLSSFWLLMLSAAVCYAVSHRCHWLAGTNSRVNSDDALLNGSSSHFPSRPRKYSQPFLVLLLVFRLEILHHVNLVQQCAFPGVQSFLCLVLIAYEIFVSRQRWGLPSSEEEDDPWRSCFDDLYDWFTGPRVTMVVMSLSACLYSLGTYFSLGHFTASTFICFEPLDSRQHTLFLQLVALFFDAAIIVLFWRILSWTRSAKSKLQILAHTLGLASLLCAALWLGDFILNRADSLSVTFQALRAIDVLTNSVALAVLVVSAAFWICETSPITPVSVTTFLVGTYNSCLNVLSIGDWMHLDAVASLVPMWLITVGAVFFLYTHNLRWIIFLPRPLLSLALTIIVITLTVITFTRHSATYGELHPISTLIYDAQVSHRRWLIEAATSQSLAVAVNVYQERHSGRVPPPNFSQWYDFAKGSIIIDDFRRIDKDLEPFWLVTPTELRAKAQEMASRADTTAIVIKNGHVVEKDAESNEDVKELVAMIDKFGQYLPDMTLPINLASTPRVLSPWSKRQAKGPVDVSFIDGLLSKRRTNGSLSLHGRNDQEQSSRTTVKSTLTRANDFHRMQIDACPASSLVRMNSHWDIGRFCSECVKNHSRGQFLNNFDQSLETCKQPDLKYLHGFSLTDTKTMPLRHVAPLFSASKTDEFLDIIIPLPRSQLEKPDITWQLSRRYDNLFWRGVVGDGAVSDQELRGSHKFRLLNLIKRPRAHEKITMVFADDKQEGQFMPEKVSAAEANRALPFTVGMDYSGCSGRNCDAIKHAFGTETDSEEALEYRYVLLTDEDDGPPKELLRTIRSGSVPFVSTIFQTWYTERIKPWLHFVPVDTRYQALHATFAYFTGTKDRPLINGRVGKFNGRQGDAEWISREGQKWAKQALRKEDMEIHLFRLLLEWGRLIDDRRNEIGYWQGEKGEFHNEGWTRGTEGA